MTADLRRRVTRLAGPDVDPDRLAGTLAWVVDPARTLAGLRHAVDQQRAGTDVAGALDAVLRPPADHLVAAIAELVGTWLDLGVQVATVGDDAYPAGCRAGWPHVDAPPLLAWRGRPPGDGPTVAIVGARRATGYGTGVAAWLASAVADAGACVVSGGAVGIDAAAHLAALEAPGGTTVVLGCGHAVRYPRPHAGPGGLFDRIVDHGGTVLSEQLPHAPAAPFNVRARNRIVAGLADVVVVVEGGARSGALVTATEAAERGTPVLAVPGDVRAPGSVAPHRLLAEGAGPCTSPSDVLGLLGGATVESPTGSGSERSSDVSVSVLPADVHAELVAAWPRPLLVDDLAARTGRPAAVLLGALTRARVAGETADDASGIRLRRAPR
ncbi:MAG: DNA-processing protein DprA [Nitriliruptor sp.]|uniref:DNA-processing protein DprA n=1 Tax=Nitriliruptor sp. TaxID=2448056 RepID=UPI0034A0ADB1